MEEKQDYAVLARIALRAADGFAAVQFFEATKDGINRPDMAGWVAWFYDEAEAPVPSFGSMDGAIEVLGEFDVDRLRDLTDVEADALLSAYSSKQ